MHSPLKTPHGEVGIVGAGAAGLMAAIHCAEKGLRVLLLDGQNQIGAKILMSGGTRCNVTNVCVTERDFNSGEPRTVRNILRTFPAENAVRFFESLGVPLVQETGGKYFPETHSAKTVLEALLRRTAQLRVDLRTGHKVREVRREPGRFLLRGEGFQFETSHLVICTGGLSYPGTGSDGSGYALARSLGHTLVETFPALTPLKAADAVWRGLSGISFPAGLELWTEDMRILRLQGDFLFTHFGFSGPAVLDMSRHWVRASQAAKTALILDSLPHITEEDFRRLWIEAGESRGRIAVKTLIAAYLPSRFAEYALRRAGLDPEKRLGTASRGERETALRALKFIELKIQGAWGYGKAEATAGGVDLREVHSKTLESLKQPGLYFAGEILDVDGRIGGFNFQWAWSSAYTVSLALAGLCRTESSK